MKRIPLALVFLLMVLGWVSHVLACSILPGADFLSNYEMVKAADAIVLARSREALPAKEDTVLPWLRFEIIKVVKGSYPKNRW